MRSRPYVVCRVYNICYLALQRKHFPTPGLMLNPSSNTLFTLHWITPYKSTLKEVYSFISSLFHPKNITEHVYNMNILRY